MKKLKVLYLIGGIVFINLVIICLGKPQKEMLVTKDISTHPKSYSNAISMMYETEAGSGEYVESKESTWPQDGYTFNENLSKCENGSTLSWNEANKKVLMSGNTSDKCYVYFDKNIPTIAEACQDKELGSCIAENYKLDKNIYYHKNLENSAEDSSYRYAGSYESVNNYVCFGLDEEKCDNDHLYRIIGVFGNQVKLIKADFATEAQLGTTEQSEAFVASSYGNYKGQLIEIPKYNWSGSSSNQVNSWTSSTLNTNALNTIFLEKFSVPWQSKIATTSWQVGGNTFANIAGTNAKIAYTNEIISPVTGQNAVSNKIGLMYVSDYMYAASSTYWTKVGYIYDSSNLDGCTGCTKDYRAAIGSNWMYSGINEWTISRNTGNTNYAFCVNNTGYVHSNYVSNFHDGVRPSFYLESNVKKIGGSGTSTDPYRIF